MVKRMLTFQVICAMLLCAVPTLAEPAPPSEGQPTPKNAPATLLTEIFRSSDGTTTFRYPRGWVVVNDATIDGWIVANSLETAEGLATDSEEFPPRAFGMLVAFTEAPARLSYTPTQVLNLFLGLAASEEEVTFGEVVELSIAGQRAARVSLGDPDGIEEGSVIALDLGGAMIVVAASAEKADYAVFEPIMYEMLATFEYSG